MSAYGPEERALFESEASLFYDEVLSAGSIAVDDPRIAEDGERRAAFDQLRDLGLLQRSQDGDAWVPEDPATVQSRVVSPLSQEGARLLEESTQWARAFSGMSHAWRRSPMAESRGPFTYLQGPSINTYLEGLVADAEEEVLTAQPQTGRGASALADAALRDTVMLERGVKMRTLYQHSARRSSVTHTYVAAVAARGAEVRTLDEFFRRMIIADRRTAVIPASDDYSSAVAIREPSVVAFLIDIFERSWERARPFTNRESGTLKDIAAEQRAMTIRMLIEGHSDPVSAKRLGVSPRTYAGYVADLKAEHEAETRFQLGYTMGRLGVSGEEETGE